VEKTAFKRFVFKIFDTEYTEDSKEFRDAEGKTRMWDKLQYDENKVFGSTYRKK